MTDDTTRLRDLNSRLGQYARFSARRDTEPSEGFIAAADLADEMVAELEGLGGRVRALESLVRELETSQDRMRMRVHGDRELGVLSVGEIGVRMVAMDGRMGRVEDSLEGLSRQLWILIVMVAGGVPIFAVGVWLLFF